MGDCMRLRDSGRDSCKRKEANNEKQSVQVKDMKEKVKETGEEGSQDGQSDR